MRTTNLEQAIKLTVELRWKGNRNEHAYRSFTQQIAAELGPKCKGKLDNITSLHLVEFISKLERDGNSASTIRFKLSVLSSIFREAQLATPPLVTRGMPKVRTRPKPAPLKWWLRPEDHLRLVTLLRKRDAERYHIMADYLDFLVATGLRVEEALRLHASHFTGLGTSTPEMTVPGTKTSTAQATLPLSKEGEQVVLRRLKDTPAGGKLFPVSYRTLAAVWQECREHLGAEGIKTATLKSLRRSFGKTMSDRGMPTEVLRTLYRHSSIATTQGYLRVTGGYSNQTVRQWLDPKVETQPASATS